MPNVIIIKPAQYQRMPWKNGLGETLEIQKMEDDQGLRFRISQASVKADGVFSNFAGLHRTLVLLSGNGMTLAHSGKHTSVLNNPLDIARFSGGDETHATLHNGTIEDLNIMVRNSDTHAKVEAYTAPCSFSFSNNDTLFSGFYASEDSVIEMENAEAVTIKAHSMVTFSQNAKATLTQGRGVLVCISG
ncbi:HutD family protein [Marinomonas sp. IMCC 4694]|uniref:HutD/Ves family protein n=1 Tax=Marinomonas sp. IMCC 4694 TaxID=2605432 RepID=UPI0011E87844|nr:HutD family protein [Marinomonas sp. IMCC 4694]TYL48808.1 HutD family protein [Marinomonas sp. IMCC 4694]